MITTTEAEAYADKLPGTDADTLLGHLMPAEILIIGVIVGARKTVESTMPELDDLTARIDDLIANLPTEH